MIPETKISDIDPFFVNKRKVSGGRIERWEQTNYNAIATCDDPGSITVSETLGVSEEQSVQMKSYCEAKLGIPTFASFKSGLESSITNKISWSSAAGIARTFPASARGCGTVNYLLYREVHDYRLLQEKKRWFRKPTAKKLPEFSERTGQYLLEMTHFLDHPICPCGDAIGTLSGKILIKISDTLSIVTDVFVKPSGLFTFNLGGEEDVPIDLTATPNQADTISLGHVPDLIRDLANLDSNDGIEGQVISTQLSHFEFELITAENTEGDS